jgi:hypothetical protein
MVQALSEADWRASPRLELQSAILKASLITHQWRICMSRTMIAACAIMFSSTAAFAQPKAHDTGEAHLYIVTNVATILVAKFENQERCVFARGLVKQDAMNVNNGMGVTVLCIPQK